MLLNRPCRRRASTYFLVLASASIVAMAGLSALTLQRVRLRGSRQDAALAQARFYAQSAIDLGLAWVEQDPDWRDNRPSGLWVADMPVGNGTFTLEGIDPGDNNLKDGNYDPLVLTGTGFSGPARYKLQVALTVSAWPLTCLEVSLHANNDVVVTDPSTVDGDQIISANDVIQAIGNCTIYPASESVNGFVGSVGPGPTTFPITPRTMPDPVTVFDYYREKGTWIPIDSLDTVGGVCTIADTLLSPATAPYGSGETNAEGIYVIDCQSRDVQIRDSRIVGTLVLLNAGTGSAIYNSVNWEPAVANYPALLVSGSMDLAYTKAALAENGSYNYNPPGTPYEGVADMDTGDTYPSVIKGLVYASGDILTDKSPIPIDYSLAQMHPTVDGALIVGNTLTLANEANLDVAFRSVYLNDPPPGFSISTYLRISPGTWRQVVD
ncbi:MAG: hypothetical protein JSU68_00530 [Phycisphaerales bacterium]|nr:MAG: hypothetical protein JSU68_00530 [Phycisphaerales bacterium]